MKKVLIIGVMACLAINLLTGCGPEEKEKDTHVADVVKQVQKKEVPVVKAQIKWADMIGDEVRVRKEHNLGSEVLGHLYKTQKVQILEKYEAASGRTWCKVKVKDSNLSGWIAGEFCSVDGKVQGKKI